MADNTQVTENVESSQNFVSAKDLEKFIIIRLDGKPFGVVVDNIEDILLPQKITPIPLAPREVMGALNLRGRIVTAINMRVRLGMEDIGLRKNDDGEHDYRCIVVQYKDGLYSLIVDEVNEVIDISKKQIEQNPENLSPDWKKISSGVYAMEKEIMIISFSIA